MSDQDQLVAQARAGLYEFVGSRTEAWQVYESGDRVAARRTDSITGEYVWVFQIEPLPESGLWRVACRKGLHADPMEPRIGTLADCTSWLDSRLAEWKRERLAAIDLEGFASARPSWRFHDDDGGRYWAGRHFDYVDGERFLLSISPYAPARHFNRFRVQINMAFSAGPEHEYVTDTIDGGADFVREWEKLLAVPLRLAESDLDEAKEVVARLKISEVAALCALLDIPGSVPACRRRLVGKYCPAKASKRSVGAKGGDAR